MLQDDYEKFKKKIIIGAILIPCVCVALAIIIAIYIPVLQKGVGTSIVFDHTKYTYEWNCMSWNNETCEELVTTSVTPDLDVNSTKIIPLTESSKKVITWAAYGKLHKEECEPYCYQWTLRQNLK